jgi:glycosyltransferase involved in cell wall biosynthesis
MRLTVASVAFSLAPVGAPGAGGAEEILGTLDRALVEAGHVSLVVAWRGSRTAGTLIGTPPEPGPFDEVARERARAEQRRALTAALARYPVDLIHLHGLDFDQVLPNTKVPVLVTLHLPLDRYAPGAIDRAPADTEFVAVSLDQLRFATSARPIGVIENGVPLDEYRPAAVRRDSFLALGRVCEEKGFPLALDAGRRAHAPVILAGPLAPYPEHLAYFRDEIVPRLDGRRRYFGGARGLQKARLIAQARAVLIPSLARETSSLVAMEALASGTPVIAFRSGALASIVEDGVTGLLVDDVDGLVAAMADVGRIDPAACRRAAEARFSAARMCGEYLALYRDLARRTARAAS